MLSVYWASKLYIQLASYTVGLRKIRSTVARMRFVHVALIASITLNLALLYESSQLNNALRTAELQLSLARNANEALAGSIRAQKDELDKLRKQIKEANEAADRAAKDILDGLDKRVSDDHQAGTDPEDMNQWLEGLFQ